MGCHEAVAAVMATSPAPLGAAVGWAVGDHRQIAVAGERDSAGSPVTPDTVFDLASVTKVLVTCAVQRLVALGQVTYDDPVQRFGVFGGCHPGTTLESVLRHRAGLWEWQPLYLAGTDPWDALEALGPRYPLDAARHYSDLGFMVIGRVIESVTGLGLAQSVAELVTRPLGMVRTLYGSAAENTAASGWGDAIERRMVATGEPYPVRWSGTGFDWRETELTGQANDGNAFHAWGGVAGHAGLFADVGDLLTLTASLSAAERGIWGNLDPLLADGPDAGQALGWRSLDWVCFGQRTRLYWHPGFTGCAIGFIPGDGIGVVVATNRLLTSTDLGHAQPPMLDVMHVVLDQLDLPPAGPPSGGAR